MRKLIVLAGSLAVLFSHPARAEESDSQSDLTCLIVISKVTENYLDAMEDPATPVTKKRELENSLNEMMAPASWFTGRVSMLAADVRSREQLNTHAAKIAKMPNDEFAVTVNRCLANFADGRASTLDRLWRRP